MSFTKEQVLQLARQAYESGQAIFPLDSRRAALLVIDMQLEFVQPGWTPYWVPAATAMIPRLGRVLAAARGASRPVIHTAFAATNRYLDRPASGHVMPNRYPDFSAENLFVEAHFPTALQPSGDELLILKPSYGAFYDTSLDTILRNLGCNTVVVTGTLTNLCCSTTARQAYERGYAVIFGSDVTATHTDELQQAELQTMRYGFARVLNAQEICDFFCQRFQ